MQDIIKRYDITQHDNAPHLTYIRKAMLVDY